MSTTRDRQLRMAAAARISYAEPASSSEDDGGDESVKPKRKVIKKRAKGKARADDEASSSDDDDKPRKKARKVGKGSKSKSKAMKDSTVKLPLLEILPVELAMEIFSHLDWPDLLALSVVSQHYRQLLTAESSTRLWSNARERIKLRAGWRQPSDRLPSMTLSGFKEWHYAQLIFGTRCQFCGSGRGSHFDCFLRARFCKACRKHKIVDVTTLYRIDPKLLAALHPLATDCVIRTPHVDYGVSSRADDVKPCAMIDDLRHYSALLYELEEQDEDSDMAKSRPERHPASTSQHYASSRSGRKRRAAIYRDETTDDEDGLRPVSHRVQDFVNGRKETIRAAWWRIHDYLKERNLNAKERKEQAMREKRRDVDSRANQIKRKVLDLDAGYSSSDFEGAWTTNKLINSDEPLTDGEWDRIQPRVLKLLDREGVKRESANTVGKQQLLQQSLRPYYDQLKGSLPHSARPFVPPFLDFLLLPSVKELWMPCEFNWVSKQEWDGQLDAIKAELEEYRVDLVFSARDIIGAATSDPAERRAGEDDPMPNDAFFELATSFLCCSFDKCPKLHVNRRRRWWLHRDESEDDQDPRLGAIGPLVEVLKHQHDKHNATDYIEHKTHFSREPQFHLSLPLEVACGMSAILDLVDLDPTTTGLRELNRIEKAVASYEWHNTKTYKKLCYSKPKWLDLLSLIKREGERLGRFKQPIVLDPPCIVLHRRAGAPWPPHSDSESDLANEPAESDGDIKAESDDGGSSRQQHRFILDSDVEGARRFGGGFSESEHVESDEE
ncbi:SCF ubiquitin ligase complex subunit UFO1 [Rhodotorula paludigena]|uniref:SCF ubiquitin ligase complex subunit UFO1 n=1 Tax=Rhodotorula paludigena TaxID=86838 RepID=UPI003177FACE